MIRTFLSLLLVFALVVNTASAGIKALGENALLGYHLLTQGEPPMFNEALPTPEAPFTNGRTDNRDGIWDTNSLQALGETEESMAAQLALPSGLSATPRTNLLNQAPSTMLVGPKRDTGIGKSDESDSGLPPGARASLSPFAGPGNPAGGPPLPWEAGFPGGGSNSVNTVVNSNTGNLTLSVPIFNWKTRGGRTVDLSLYYNSRGYVQSRFGLGWSCTFDACVQDLNWLDDLMVYWGDGTAVRFKKRTNSTTIWDSPSGLHQTLTKGLTEWVLKTKDGIQYVFERYSNWGSSAPHYLTKIRERIAENVVTIERPNTSGVSPATIKGVTDPGGQRISFGGDSRVTSINDFWGPPNRTWTLGYDGSGRLNAITYPANGAPATRTFTYQNTFLSSETDLRGKVWRWGFDVNGICQWFTTPTTDHFYMDQREAYYFVYSNDSCKLFTPGRTDYGSFFRTVAAHQYENGKIRHLYDTSGYSDGTSTYTGFYESYTWDSLRHIGTYTDKRRKTWTYQADTMGNVTQVTSPLGIIDKFNYDSNTNDLLQSYSDQITPSCTEYSYDSGGRVLVVKRRATPASQVNYPIAAATYASGALNGHLGQVDTVTSYGPNGSGPWPLTYPSQGPLSQYPSLITDPNMHATNMTVDAFGRVLSVQGPTVSPAVGATTITYDDWGRPWKMTHPDSSYTQVTYDPEGNVTQARDENGHISYWTYDDDGRVTSFQNAKPNAEIEYYTYDDHGFLKKVTNARGYERNYVPNYRDEVYKLTHADGQKEYWTYYATGEVSAYTNGYGSPDQTMAAYGYDNDGRPTGVTYSPSNTPSVTFSYGTVGTTERTVTMTDGTGATTWHYDGFGRLLELDQPGPYVITYGYTDYHDAAVSMTDPSGTTYYTYNNMGQLWKLKNPLNETTEWLYDAASRLTQRKLANGTSDNVGYDSRSRVSTIALKNSSQTLLRQHYYGYDLASNITSDNVAGVTTTYGYDEINQLTSENRPGYSCAYTYDKNGNRATRTLNSVVETYTSDAADKLTSISVGGQTTRSITYDFLGRRKTDTHDGATSTYNWDQESRITSITRPGMQTHTFDYNGLDTRVSRTLAGNTTTTYKRNGASVTNPVVLETTNGVATNHTPGISEKRGTAASTYLHSGMKNADARTSATQTVDASRQYDAFGNLASSAGTWNGPFGYAGGLGYQEDVESGLKLLGHRYYDSTTGSFVCKDSASAGRNWTSYCANSPVGRADPKGLMSSLTTPAGAAEAVDCYAIIDGVETVETVEAAVMPEISLAEQSIFRASMWWNDLSPLTKLAIEAILGMFAGAADEYAAGKNACTLHKELEGQAKGVQGRGITIENERSYKDRIEVPCGTRGSIRLDTTIRENGRPTAVIDYKFGNALLNAFRRFMMNKHLPDEFDGVPIIRMGKWSKPALTFGGTGWDSPFGPHPGQ